MSDPAQLARLVAAQLGGDLDRILGDVEATDAPAAPQKSDAPAEASPAAPKGEPYELRQIAGRGAGLGFKLTPGRYDLGPTTSPPGMPGSADPNMTPFRLEVDEELNITLIVLERAVLLDGRRVTDGIKMRGGVIDAHAARFEITKRFKWEGDAPPTTAEIKDALPALQIPVMEIPGAMEEEEQQKRKLRKKRKKEEPQFKELTKAVLMARSRAIRRERMLQPTMSELLNRIKTGRGHVWTIDQSNDQFAKVIAAYGDRPWTPPYDRPDKVSNVAAHAVHQFLETPSVPIVVDLKAGCFGIIGPREATLAAVRHMALSQAIVSSPRDLEIAVVSDEQRQRDWAWADALPHRKATSESAMPLVLIDGLAQIGAKELRSVMASPELVGAILIEDELGDLPSVCSTVMEIRPDGSATLMDFTRGSTIVRSSTPIGVTLRTIETGINDLVEALTAQSVQASRPASGLPQRGGQAPANPAMPQRTGDARREGRALPKIAIPEGVKMHDNIQALPQRSADGTKKDPVLPKIAIPEGVKMHDKIDALPQRNANRKPAE